MNVMKPGARDVRLLQPVTAELPEGAYSEPLAPWRVSARDEWGSAKVELRVFSVTQDGPDEPRVLRQTPVVMDAEQAQQLVDALTAAVLFCDASEEVRGDGGAD